jgi:hypothetical protein
MGEEMRVFTFGDSHAGKFGGDDRFVLYGPPAPTAYGLANENSRSQSLFMLRHMLLDMAPDDIILFVIGEIDCRVHVYRQHILTGRHPNTIISETVQRFGHIVKSVAEDNNVEVAILDVPPAVAQGNIYLYDHYGTRDQRAEIARRWNIILGEFCKKNDICFVEIYPHIADERGWLKPEFAVEDEAHVNGAAVPLVVQELRKCFPEL